MVASKLRNQAGYCDLGIKIWLDRADNAIVGVGGV